MSIDIQGNDQELQRLEVRRLANLLQKGTQITLHHTCSPNCARNEIAEVLEALACCGDVNGTVEGMPCSCGHHLVFEQMLTGRCNACGHQLHQHSTIRVARAPSAWLEWSRRRR